MLCLPRGTIFLVSVSFRALELGLPLSQMLARVLMQGRSEILGGPGWRRGAKGIRRVSATVMDSHCWPKKQDMSQVIVQL